MIYSFKFLYKVCDYTGNIWNVRSERPTVHGWLLLVGRQADPGDGDKNCRGGDKVIITRELAAYMESMRMMPGAIDLPVCTATITRLRRDLGLNFNSDRAGWWDERRYDLTARLKDFAEMHSISTATVARQCRSRGITRKPPRWSQDEKALLQCLLRENIPIKEIAVRMGKTVGAIKVMRRRLVGNISNTRPWTEEEKAEAIRLLTDGIPAKDVAARLGRSKLSLFAMRTRTVGAVSLRKKHWLD